MIGKSKVKSQKSKLQKGFTLIEILVVMAVLITAGIILTQIFINTLRTSNKAAVISLIKQNGQSVLETLDKDIRNAQQVVDICNSDGNPTLDTLMIKDKDGIYKRYRFTPMVDPSTNGSITQEIISVDAGGTLLTDCTDPLPSPPPTSGTVTLTDTNLQKGVSVGTTSQFTSHPQAGFKDSITIDFTLGPGVKAARIIKEQVDPIQFLTTIQLR